MAGYLAVRFHSLNRLAPYYHSVTDAIAGRGVPLNAAGLQAELRIDEVDRTAGKSKNGTLNDPSLSRLVGANVQ